MFQLKSNLRCTVCKKKKVNFETNYVIDLPLLMNRVVKCEIKLYKLPYYLKVYLDIINEKFHQYNIDNKMNSNNEVNVLKDNLKEYYLKFTKEELQREKYDVNIYKFVVDIEREEKFGTIVKILKGIQKLDLEYYEKEKNIEKKIDEDDIKEYIITVGYIGNYYLVKFDKENKNKLALKIREKYFLKPEDNQNEEEIAHN